MCCVGSARDPRTHVPTYLPQTPKLHLKRMFVSSEESHDVYHDTKRLKGNSAARQDLISSYGIKCGHPTATTRLDDDGG
jgi:hypothetical protein